MRERPILVVDDDGAIRELLVEIFEEQGFRVLTAADGRIALDIAARVPLSALVLDLRLPVVDGRTVARTLRERGFMTPIIVISVEPAEAAWLEELQIDAYFLKPFNLDTLLQVVRGLDQPMRPVVAGEAH